MTSCTVVRALFSDYREGVLSEADADTVRRHVAACVGCTRVWRRFEDSLAALRRLAPPTPEGMEARTRELVLRSWRRPRLAGPRVWALAVVVAVAIALAAVLLQRHEAPPPRAEEAATAGPACAEQMRGLWKVDVPGLRSPLPRQIPKARLTVGREALAIPALLVTHGPYDAAVGEAVASGDVVCVPLLAAYGDVLVLSIANTAAVQDGAAFRTETDPTRVLYTRVLWTHDGRLWRLEGRAPASDLLALAEEIDSQVQPNGG